MNAESSLFSNQMRQLKRVKVEISVKDVT